MVQPSLRENREWWSRSLRRGRGFENWSSWPAGRSGGRTCGFWSASQLQWIVADLAWHEAQPLAREHEDIEPDDLVGRRGYGGAGTPTVCHRRRRSSPSARKKGGQGPLRSATRSEGDEAIDSQQAGSSESRGSQRRSGLTAASRATPYAQCDGREAEAELLGDALLQSSSLVDYSMTFAGLDAISVVVRSDAASSAAAVAE